MSFLWQQNWSTTPMIKNLLYPTNGTVPHLMQNVTYVEVCNFRMGDVEDPELYASIPLGEWLTTEKGKWVKDYSSDMVYAIMVDVESYGYRCVVRAAFDEATLNLYILKWK
jgi:hypothetical protein